MSAPSPDDATTPLLRTLAPTEEPLRPLCPACGGDRVRIRLQVPVSVEVGAPSALSDLQVLSLTLDDMAWDDHDAAACARCDWRGTVAELSAPERHEAHDRARANG